MTLRMLRTTRAPRGFRSRPIVIITTILDPAEASAAELLALDRDRWTVELNLRSLKTTLGMEFLRGKSVEGVRKEIITHLLLDNLIRLLMWEAARGANQDPQRLSFAGTLHRRHAVAGALLMRSPPGWNAARLLKCLLEWIAGDARFKRASPASTATLSADADPAHLDAADPGRVAGKHGAVLRRPGRARA